MVTNICNNIFYIVVKSPFFTIMCSEGQNPSRIIIMFVIYHISSHKNHQKICEKYNIDIIYKWVASCQNQKDYQLMSKH